MLTARFYVYEHWRPDLDICFWVGKGTGDRAYRFKRNRDYDHIVTTLSTIGMCVEVRLVQSGLIESEALRIERERIVFWRAMSVTLSNRTDGGDGNRGLFVSDVTREKLRFANLGKKQSEVTKAKRRASLTGKKHKNHRTGFKHSVETIAKIRASNLGQKRSEELKEKVRLANLGKKHSLETRAKMSAQRMGNTWGRGGKGVKHHRKKEVAL